MDRSPMTVEDSPELLDELIERAVRARGSAPVAAAVLEAFRTFADHPLTDADPAQEVVLAESGTRDFRGTEEFGVGMSRLVTVGEDGDDPGAQFQVGVMLYWPPTPETRSLGMVRLWSDEVPDHWEATREIPAFAWALSGGGGEPDVYVDGQWV